MATTIQFTFDDTWAVRIAAMVEHPARLERDEIIQALLDAAGKTWEELSPKQRFQAIVLRDTMERLMDFEAGIASQAAAQTVLDDIRENFPLALGAA